MNRFALLFLLLAATEASAAPPDSVVLTYWGQWTLDQAVDGLNRAQSLGANQVTVLVQLCQTDAKASAVRYCFDQPGQDLPWAQSYEGQRMDQLAAAIVARGMTFNLMPILALDSGDNRHYILPSDRGAWFASYGAKLQELAAYAQHYGNESLIIGSELTSMYFFESEWRSMIANLRTVYSGAMTISTVIGTHELIVFWDVLDAIGISAYYPLAILQSEDSATLFELAWQLYKEPLKLFADAWGKPLRFVEIGYPNTNVAAQTPWDYDWAARTYDETRAANCWQAFLSVWGSDPSLGAFQIWGLSNPQDDINEPKAFSPVGKASATVIRQIFTARGALP